ncbi:MAG: hypothetical protein JSV04_00270 [Candidatus Heimdallarchaeota archaeon]|nr:MAG: hypothetical protein JSV04_00270 [Candidatus Heimdallarchaeota archaeon]
MSMKNIDDFFGDDESQNVKTLITVTKKFFVFVSQLVEIVDELEKNYNELANKVNQLQKSGLSSSPPPTSAVSSAPPTPVVSSAPPPAPATPSTPPGLPSLPTPPSPTTASAPPSSPAPQSGLPPLPNMASPPQTFGPPPTQHQGFQGLTPVPQATAPPPRPSPMNLKAQMNLELKEAFARIKKGWSEDE